MSTERLVKWSKEGKEFFEKAKDNSIATFKSDYIDDNVNNLNNFSKPNF
ncbi:MAG: hypothetical protein LBB44_02170 [Endomicrobium sp.]|jgi:hypothetical protein|nr:hypothetical protein [Endomicrobium sp.]